RPHDADPLLGCAFALAHARFLRLLGNRLVRKHADPDLPAALDEPGHRHARCLDLPIGQPAGLERTQAVVAERDVRPPPGLARHPTALLLAVFDFLRHQHNEVLTLSTLHSQRPTLPVVWESGRWELSASPGAGAARRPI